MSEKLTAEGGTHVKQLGMELKLVWLFFFNFFSSQAAQLRVAEKYVEAFGNLAQKGTTMLLPSNPADTGSMGK